MLVEGGLGLVIPYCQVEEMVLERIEAVPRSKMWVSFFVVLLFL